MKHPFDLSARTLAAIVLAMAPCLASAAASPEPPEPSEAPKSTEALEAHQSPHPPESAPLPKALDASLDCSSTGHAFIAPLLAHGDIRSQPMHVEPNSMNAFRTRHPLTAYGFPVFVVLGYQADDPIFTHGDGKPIGEWAYGVVVRGMKDAVEAHVREAGSPAVVHEAFPFLTAIVCSSK